jgi:hypothetical protein
VWPAGGAVVVALKIRRSQQNLDAQFKAACGNICFKPGQFGLATWL